MLILQKLFVKGSLCCLSTGRTVRMALGRLRVVSLSLSPSSETRKKPARKKKAARDPGGEKQRSTQA